MQEREKGERERKDGIKVCCAQQAPSPSTVGFNKIFILSEGCNSVSSGIRSWEKKGKGYRSQLRSVGYCSAGLSSSVRKY